MSYEYRIIEGMSRQITEQINLAAAEGWEPFMMGVSGQSAASGTAMYVHTTLLLRRPTPEGQVAPAQE